MFFFQNASNKKIFEEEAIVKQNTRIIPGSGVNLTQHPFEEYPNDKKISFLFIGRIFGPERVGDIKHSNASIKKAEKLLKYNPNWSFDKGISEAIEWYKGNL